MARFTVARGKFGEHETVILEDSKDGAKAVVARAGATLLSYSVPWQGKLFDVTDGCATPEELVQRNSGRALIMAPWSNRIDNGQYEWGGERHDLGVTDTRNRVILHGFVAKGVWDVTAERGGDEAAAVTLLTRALRKGAFRGYPFDVDVQVAFALKPGRLEGEIAGRNVGPADAPFGCGWHPYFKTPTPGINQLKLLIPCRKKIMADARLLPLPGDAAYAPIEKAPDFDFRPGSARGNVLGTLFIDDAFTDLDTGCLGWAQTAIEDPASGMRLTVLQERGLMHVFTGDTLGTRRRGGLALEPVEFMTNAFNRPECRAALALKPGAARSFKFAVEAAKI